MGGEGKGMGGEGKGRGKGGRGGTVPPQFLRRSPTLFTAHGYLDLIRGFCALVCPLQGNRKQIVNIQTGSSIVVTYHSHP